MSIHSIKVTFLCLHCGKVTTDIDPSIYGYEDDPNAGCEIAVDCAACGKWTTYSPGWNGVWKMNEKEPKELKNGSL